MTKEAISLCGALYILKRFVEYNIPTVRDQYSRSKCVLFRYLVTCSVYGLIKPSRKIFVNRIYLYLIHTSDCIVRRFFVVICWSWNEVYVHNTHFLWLSHACSFFFVHMAKKMRLITPT